MSTNVCSPEANNNNNNKNNNKNNSASFEAVRFCANTVWANQVDSFHRANLRLWIATNRLNRHDTANTAGDRSGGWGGGGGGCATTQCDEIVKATDEAACLRVDETKCHELFGRNRNTGGPWLLPEVEAALRRFTSEVGSRHDSIWTNKVVEERSPSLFGRQGPYPQLKTRTCARYPAKSLTTTFNNYSEERCSATDLSKVEDDLDAVHPSAAVHYKVKTPEDRELHKRIASCKVKRLWCNSSSSRVTSSLSSSKTSSLGYFGVHDVNPTTLNANVPEFFPNAAAASSTTATDEEVLPRRPPLVFPSSLKGGYEDALFPYRNTSPPPPPRSPPGRLVRQSSLSDASNYLPIPLPPRDPSSARSSCKGSPREDKRTTLAGGARASQPPAAAKNMTNWRVTAVPPATQGDLWPPCSTSFWSSFTKHHHKTGTSSSVSNKFKRESYASLSARSSIYRNTSPDKDGSVGSNVLRSGLGAKLSEDPSQPASIDNAVPLEYGSGKNATQEESHVLSTTSRSCDSPYGGPEDECPDRRPWSSGTHSSAPPSLCSAPSSSLGRPAGGVHPRSIPVYQRPVEFYLTPDVMLHTEKKHQGRGADHSNLIVLTGATKRHFHPPASAKAAVFPFINDLSSVATMERDFPPLIMVDPEPSPPGVDEDDESLQLLNGNHDHDFKRQMDWLRKYYASRVDWFTHASLLSDELALIEEQTVMEALEDIERDCNEEFPPISSTPKRSPQKKLQPVEVLMPQARTPSETSLDLATTESRRDLSYVVQLKLSYKDVLASPAPLKSGDSFHELLEKLPTEETKTPNDTLQVTKSPEESFVVYPKYQESPQQKQQQATENPPTKQAAVAKSAKRPPSVEPSTPVVGRSEVVKPQPPSLLSLGPIKRPTMLLATTSRSQHDVRATATFTPATLSKSYTRVVEALPKEVVATPKSPRKRGCTKMILVTPTTMRPPYGPEDTDPEEGDGPLIVLAAPSPPGTKGIRLLVQEVFKDKMAAVVAKGRKKKKKATTVAPPDGNVRNDNADEVEAVLVSKPDPNEKRTQVSTTTSLQPAKTNTDSEPQVRRPSTDMVQETWDSAEVNAASTPIARTPPPVRGVSVETTPTPTVTTPRRAGWTSFRDDVSRSSTSATTADPSSFEHKWGSRSSGSKPVWMKQKKKRTSSGNKKKQRGGGGGARGSKRLPSPPSACECDRVTCCQLSAEWMRTGDVKFQLYETLNTMETEVVHFKELAIETRDRTPADKFPQTEDLLCLKVADKMKEILPRMREIFRDFDSGYISCVNCELGKMIFKKIMGLKKHFENFETQLLSQGLFYFMCYLKEFVEPSEMVCEPLSHKILSNFQSEYAGCVLLYHGNPKAMFLQSIFANLTDYYEITLSNKKRTIFDCIPSTICYRVILTLKHTMMDLKMCLGTQLKDIHTIKSVQIVTETPKKEDLKHQLINSRRNLRRELFKPAPPPRSTSYNRGYLAGCADAMHVLAEEENKVSSAVAPAKGKVAPNISETSAKQAKNENILFKNTNIESNNSIPEENVARKKCSRVLKEPVDKREAVRREMERTARDHLPERGQLRKATRSKTSPALMITSNVKSAPYFGISTDGYTANSRQRRLKSKSCGYGTDDLKRAINFKNGHHNATRRKDVSKRPQRAVKKLLNFLLTKEGREALSTVTPQPDRELTANEEESCGDDTFCCCLEKVRAIRTLLNKYEHILPQNIRSHLFVRLGQYLDLSPCSSRIIKRERPLVWPTHVKPARIVVMVEKLQKQFILHESQPQESQYSRSDGDKFDSQNLAIEHDTAGHLDEDVAQLSDSSTLDEESREDDVNQHLIPDTKTSTNIPQEIQQTQTDVDDKHVEKPDEYQKPAEIEFTRVNDRDFPNAFIQSCSSPPQTRPESSDGKMACEGIPSQAPLRSTKSSTSVHNNRNAPTVVRAGEPARPGHPPKAGSSKTDQLMSAVKKKMSTRVHSTASVPDVVPSGGAAAAAGARGGRGAERTAGGGGARQNSHHHHTHHERSENTSCTLY